MRSDKISHLHLFRRNGALRRPGQTLLYQFLHWLQYQGSVRIIQLNSGQKPRPLNKKYELMNNCLENLWDEYEVLTIFIDEILKVEILGKYKEGSS